MDSFRPFAGKGNFTCWVSPERFNPEQAQECFKMADTVKKSRIVSDDEKDLEETLLEEFNIRLKNCMSQDNLQKEAEPPEPDETYENMPSSPQKTPKLLPENYYDEPKSIKQNGDISMMPSQEQIYECIAEKTEEKLDQNYVEMIVDERAPDDFSQPEYEPMGLEETTSNLYESVELKSQPPATMLNLPTTSLTDYSEEKSPDKEPKCSAKDRMLLSCDETSTLLFTQTVTSPMLTPSEENIDFLKGFQRESLQKEGEETSPDLSEPLVDDKVEEAENFYENTEFYKNTTPENMYENVLVERDCLRNVEEEDIYENIEEVLTVGEVERAGAKSNDTDDGSLEEFIRNEREAADGRALTTEPRAEKVENADNQDVVDRALTTTTEPPPLALEESTAELVEPPEKPLPVVAAPQVLLPSPNDDSGRKMPPETYKEAIAHQRSESSSNYYGKYTEVVSKQAQSDSMGNREKDTESVPPEIVKQLKSQFQNKAEVVGIVKKVPSADLKSANMIEQIKTRFEGSMESDDDQLDDSTEYSETIVESSAPGERSIKKKKVKKTRKEEKENISVTQNGNLEGQNFYTVNVRNLCRSFGDLTKLGKDRINRKVGIRTRTKSLTDMANPSNNISIENVFTGVSVQALKERFNNAGTNASSCRSKNHQRKSCFTKFDALQKKNVLHVRSSDSTKAQEKFSNGAQIEVSTNCKSCSKQVFQMEQIKAEKAVWHKNCFRCSECSKQLTVDTYESNDGSLYCKPHFKALFAPKAVEEDSSPSDKPNLGLEELQSLNVKERFQVFEQYQSQQTESSDFERGATNVKRSPSILSKLAKFQKHGMDVGVSNEALDGIPIEESDDSEVEEEEAIDGEDPDLVRAKRVQKEKPFHFTAMSDVKKRWEQGDHAREERREETKQEIQNIRTKLFMGKQEKMKEAYQQAVMESESSSNLRKNLSEKIEACDTKSIKERFEKGEVANEKLDKENRNEEEEEVYESEISKKSRSLFLELDASASKPPQVSPVAAPKLEVKKAREAYLERTSKEDVVKSTEQIEEIEVRTADIQEKFKFFETYKEPEQQKKQFRITPPRDASQVKVVKRLCTETPEREIYRDPEVVRAEEYIDDSNVAKESHTASKMLNKFRQMEENLTREPETQGPKPLKRFTPPPEPARPESRSEEESSEYEEEDEDEVDQTGKLPEDLIEAQKAARAKQLRAKFEKWEANEIKREQQNSVNIVEEFGEEQSQIESTRVLRARFEQMRDTSSEAPKSPRVKPNRFVKLSAAMPETCHSCSDKVYPFEKISIHGNIYHKNCFKCMECSSVLRMDSYCYNQGLLYCTPHFKRLFISKGNYDSAFGLDQHKEKWQNNVNNMTMA
uniref:LIM zinc-binding domain-containing protein n=1 Tax=Dendroctonus ponderosae TaxID=77166 RepID=A0AAR5PS21_DENPD